MIRFHLLLWEYPHRNTFHAPLDHPTFLNYASIGQAAASGGQVVLSAAVIISGRPTWTQYIPCLWQPLGFKNVLTASHTGAAQADMQLDHEKKKIVYLCSACVLRRTSMYLLNANWLSPITQTDWAGLK